MRRSQYSLAPLWRPAYSPQSDLCLPCLPNVGGYLARVVVASF